MKYISPFLIILFLFSGISCHKKVPSEGRSVSLDLKKGHDYFRFICNSSEVIEWASSIIQRRINGEIERIPRDIPGCFVMSSNPFGTVSWVSALKWGYPPRDIVFVEYGGGHGYLGVAIDPQKMELFDTDRVTFLKVFDGIWIYESP